MTHRLLFPVALQVAYLEGDSNYTLMHLVSGHKHVRRTTLGYAANAYPSFIRIHKQYAVNPDRITSVCYQPRPGKRPQVHIWLSSGQYLPIGERRCGVLLDELRKIVAGNKRRKANNV